MTRSVWIGRGVVRLIKHAIRSRERIIDLHEVGQNLGAVWRQVVLFPRPPGSATTVARERLYQAIQKLLPLIEVLDENPLVLPMCPRVIHVAEDPAHAVDRNARAT